MKVVHSSQLYKRSKLRYKPTTLSLCVNEQEETELRYCRTGCRERVVPWHKVLGVHVLADTCALEFHTKMNTVDDDLVHMMNTSADIVERDFDGLVLANEAPNFSAGANLMMVVMYANQGKFEDIEAMVKAFQDANQRLTYLAKPVVAAPHGLTLGGGCEMALVVVVATASSAPAPRRIVRRVRLLLGVAALCLDREHTLEPS